MKKSILTVLAVLLISISAMAQSKNEKRAIKATNNKIELIEKITKLSDLEKETFTELNNAFAIKHFSLRDLKESDPAKYKEEVKANGADFAKKLTAALGKERSTEIINASKKKKNNKKKNKKE
ncbi:hypothetical protein EV196_1024 [Mariniflexile fucanivorans]|uniref:DUF4168 domain-containing protein n=1 Tax=Mariniflexile fucanivorans TaxID=264023 RepID=A0A4R1RMF3_9FLAO|nr:hypothetical protein [Mariniflexile fucanivorans]TCL67448.1 hypothetical protein EV196_1024 [Mariniflexile fucanivorans]